MDVLGVRAMKSQKAMKRSRRDKAVKVVYISSPMKVKASASGFRALVQELTGRHSDAERTFMEMEMEMERDINADVGGHIGSSHRPIAGHHHHDHQKIRTAHEEIDGRDDDQSFDVFGFCNFPLEFGNGTSSSLFSPTSFTIN